MRERAREGEMLVLGPRYFEMLEAVRPGPVYPDANGTLRFSYARVEGYRPRDGLQALPRTTVAGQVAKDTGEPPFDLPAVVREAAATAPATAWADHALGDVPVCFLFERRHHRRQLGEPRRRRARPAGRAQLRPRVGEHRRRLRLACQSLAQHRGRRPLHPVAARPRRRRFGPARGARGRRPPGTGPGRAPRDGARAPDGPVSYGRADIGAPVAAAVPTPPFIPAPSCSCTLGGGHRPLALVMALALFALGRRRASRRDLF